MRILFTIVLLLACHLGFGQVKRVSTSDHVKRTSVFPNPAKSFVQIQYKLVAPLPTSLVIYNFLGKKLVEINQPGANVYLDLTSFNRGVYIFQFRDRNGQVVDSGKFHVEK